MSDAGNKFAATVADSTSSDVSSQQSPCVVLDTKFGNGRKFLRFLTRWLAKERNGNKLHYIACSQDPIFSVESNQGGAAVKSWIDELREQWPSGLPGLHRFEICAGRVVLTLCFGQARFYLTRLRARVDWILAEVLLENQPEQEAWMGRAFARAAATGARLNLWISSKDVPQPGVDAFIKKIESSGFRGRVIKWGLQNDVEWRGKVAASRDTGSAQRKSIVKGGSISSRGRVVIIGGGLAGTSVAGAIARRGWDVLVVEQCAGAARRASGNLAAVISPMLSKDDSLASRISRASFLQLLREIKELNRKSPSVRWDQCGVIQLPADDAQEIAFLDLLKIHQYPTNFVRYINANEVSGISGSASTTRGALFFPSSGWVNPPSLCEARLAEYRLQVCFGEQVCELVRNADHWQVFGKGSRLIAEASVVILANGFEALNLKQAQHLHFKKVRGQVTHLRHFEAEGVGTVICGDGYLTPSMDGVSSLGATYDFGVEEESVLEECNLENLNRYSKLRPGLPVPGLSAVLGGRVGFRSLTADRMPMIGQLADARLVESRSTQWERLGDIPRLPGLFTCLGLGSRGVVWSGMAGEILASLIEGEPSPIEADLLDALDPARAILREARRAFSS